jgi:hypothetical protein
MLAAFSVTNQRRERPQQSPRRTFPMNPKTITTAADKLVQAINAVNRHDKRDDAQVVEAVTAAVINVNNAAEAILAGVGPGAAAQRNRASRRSRPVEDDATEVEADTEDKQHDDEPVED